MDPVLFGMFVVVVSFLGYGAVFAVLRSAANTRDDVTAEWEGLRITATELIEGYRRKAKRHPLSGLSARVEESRTKGRHISSVGHWSIRMTIDGPHTAITRTTSLRCPNAEGRARAFAAKVNLASQQLEYH